MDATSALPVPNRLAHRSTAARKNMEIAGAFSQFQSGDKPFGDFGEVRTLDAARPVRRSDRAHVG